MVSNRLKQKGKFLKVIALLCIYGLNLVFFQGLLSDPDSDATESFNIFVSDNDGPQKSDTNHAADYYQLFKHANNSERPTLILPQDVLAYHTVIDLSALLKQELPFSQWSFYAHLPTDAFKIYKRICVFLI